MNSVRELALKNILPQLLQAVDFLTEAQSMTGDSVRLHLFAEHKSGVQPACDDPALNHRLLISFNKFFSKNFFTDTEYKKSLINDMANIIAKFNVMHNPRFTVPGQQHPHAHTHNIVTPSPSDFPEPFRHESGQHGNTLEKAVPSSSTTPVHGSPQAPDAVHEPPIPPPPDKRVETEPHLPSSAPEASRLQQLLDPATLLSDPPSTAPLGQHNIIFDGNASNLAPSMPPLCQPSLPTSSDKQSVLLQANTATNGDQINDGLRNATSTPGSSSQKHHGNKEVLVPVKTPMKQLTANHVLSPTVPMVFPSFFPSHTTKPSVSTDVIPTHGLQPSPVSNKQPTDQPPPRHPTSGNTTSGARRLDHSIMDKTETNDAVSNDDILPHDIAALAHRTLLLLTVNTSKFMVLHLPHVKFIYRTLFKAGFRRYIDQLKSEDPQSKDAQKFSSTFSYSYFTPPWLPRTLHCRKHDIYYDFQDNVLPYLQALRKGTSSSSICHSCSVQIERARLCGTTNRLSRLQLTVITKELFLV